MYNDLSRSTTHDPAWAGNSWARVLMRRTAFGWLFFAGMAVVFFRLANTARAFICGVNRRFFSNRFKSILPPSAPCPQAFGQPFAWSIQACSFGSGFHKSRSSMAESVLRAHSDFGRRFLLGVARPAAGVSPSTVLADGILAASPSSPGMALRNSWALTRANNFG